MRMGLLLGFEDSLKTLVTIAREAEAAGVGSIYTAEAGRSAFVAAAAVINATQKVKVGTYIVNAYAREPWLTGITARDLNELSEGRFVLGVGTGNIHFNRLYMGIDSSKTLAKMRDYIEIVRAVVAGKAGARVRHQGDVHSIRWRASWEPVAPTVPVYLSASGPRMLKLAGEVADGVAVGMMSSTQFLRDIVRPNASAGAQAAGRDPQSLAFPVGATVSVNRNVELARAASRASICHLFHPIPHPYYALQLRQLGFDEFVDRASELMPAGRLDEAMALVPDEVIDSMTITGTPAECAVRIKSYQGLADEIVASNLRQPGDATGVEAYKDFFELAALVR